MEFRLLLITAVFISFSTLILAQNNYSLMFDGSNDFVSIPHNNVFNVSKVTLEMRMLWENYTAPADVDFLIGKNVEQLEIHTGGGSSNHGIRFIPTTGVYLDTRTDVFESGNWYHIAFTYDPSIGLYQCYINGVQKELTNHGPNPITTAIAQSASSLRIGMRQDNSYPFQGRIDEVRIWNCVRTAGEISANMASELAGNEPGLIAYYKMSNGIGSDLTDNSPYGNHGRLENGTQWLEEAEALPVELISFSVEVNGSAATLLWKTATEVNNYGFEVQRALSYADNNWQTIGFIKGSGNSNSPREYSFTDELIDAGIIQYRLKQLDTDGSVKFFNSVTVTKAKPGQYKLHQNSPNPFNPETAIRFELPQNSFVSIKIYDLTGRELATILNNEKPAGSHVVHWNGKDQSGQSVSSGVYICKFSSADYIKVLKMNLIK